MLATRIIPTLLHRGDTLVKGKQFQSWRSVGHVQQAARIHAMRGVDELCVLNIGATPAGKGPDFLLTQKLTEGNFSPVSIGGGIRTVEDVKLLLRAGADKVVICTEAVPLIKEVAKAYGNQAIVAAIDVKDGKVAWNCGQYQADMAAVTYAVALEDFGAGEILLTSIDREGLMEGYDLKTIEAVAMAVSIPVVAHGGCGSYEHMYEAIQAGASAVAAGALFQFTDCTPKGAAEYLKAKGVEVRL